MCDVIVNYRRLRELAVSARTRFFLVALTDGLDTTNERTVKESINPLASRLPLDSCLAAHFFLPDECREFRKIQGLDGIAAPLLFISEENPFLRHGVEQRAIIELAGLATPDDVKRVLASIAEQAHDEDFLRKAKAGDVIRRIKKAIDKYGDPLRGCLTMFGF